RRWSQLGRHQSSRLCLGRLFPRLLEVNHVLHPTGRSNFLDSESCQDLFKSHSDPAWPEYSTLCPVERKKKQDRLLFREGSSVRTEDGDVGWLDRHCSILATLSSTANCKQVKIAKQ